MRMDGITSHCMEWKDRRKEPQPALCQNRDETDSVCLFLNIPSVRITKYSQSWNGIAEREREQRNIENSTLERIITPSSCDPFPVPVIITFVQLRRRRLPVNCKHKNNKEEGKKGMNCCFIGRRNNPAQKQIFQFELESDCTAQLDGSYFRGLIVMWLLSCRNYTSDLENGVTKNLNRRI